MQKITLKPRSKELTYRSDDDTTYFDVFSYNGTTNQEKNLGSLFLITHIAFEDDEDLSYIISLLSSLAKREFYSESAVKNQDTKEAFEKTLHKLNEVLDDFFTTKSFDLNVGLVATHNNDVYISKLGKFKVSLIRENEHIDVLNNVALFEKSFKSEQQFSNIISGKLQSGDQLFAYYPSRSLIAREKKLTKIFTQDTDLFFKALDEAADTGKKFSCCGMYIAFDEIKEIPVETDPAKVYASMPQAVPAASEDDSKPVVATVPLYETPDVEKKPIAKTVATPPIQPREVETTHGISAELALGRRDSWYSTLSSKIAQAKKIHTMDTRGKVRGFALIGLIVLVPVIVILAIRMSRPSEIDLARQAAQTNIEQAQSLIDQDSEKEARDLLTATLSDIALYEDKEIDLVRSSITDTINKLDKLSSIELAQVFDGTTFSGTLAGITASEDDIHVVTNAGTLYYLKGDVLKEEESFDVSPIALYGTEQRISFLGRDNAFAVYNLVTNNTGVFQLDALSTDPDAVTFYADNLYAVAGTTIHKYAEVNTGETEFTTWSKDSLDGVAQSIAVDGDIYLLMQDGTIQQFFTGELVTTFETTLSPTQDAQLFTSTDSASLYVLDNDRLYVFSKQGGRLTTTYDLRNYTITDLTIAEDGTVYLLSGNDIYTL